jgi:hypothetical protein
MKIYHIKLRRDAHTTTPLEAPEHEIAVLQSIFGEENVHNLDGKRIDEVGLTDADVAAEMQRDAAGEFDRLAARYGGNDDGLFVEQVFGKRASRGLEKAMEAVASRQAKAAGKAGK